MSKNLWIILLAAAPFMVSANPICPSCGREASTPDATVCAHCQTPFPKAAAPATPAAAKTAADAEGGPLAEPADASTREKLAFAAVKAEVAAARKLELDEKNPRPNIAFFHYRNALALAPLARLTNEAQRVAIVAGVRRTLAAVTRVDRTCPVCKGERKTTIKSPDYGQGTGAIGSRNRLTREIDCPLCHGQGSFASFRAPAEVTRFLAEGRREFETAHQAAGDRKVGYAFVSEALASGFTARERALVASGYGVPCPVCGFTGLVECRDCDGDGIVACKAKGCRSGWIIEKQLDNTYQRRHTSGTVRNAVPDVTVCPACGGVAQVRCETCGGKRMVPCKKCAGEGFAPLCRRCNGTGLIECRKCNGTGKTMSTGRDKQEIECPVCHGLGETTCTACEGLGRRGN